MKRFQYDGDEKKLENFFFAFIVVFFLFDRY